MSLVHLGVLPVLRLQQALVVRFDAEREVRAGDNVSPVAPDGHFVTSLFRHTQKKNTPLMLWLCAPVQQHCVEQTEADLIVHSGREQTGIIEFVDAFPHFEGHAPLPPSDILLFVDDATLQIEERAQSEHTVGLRNISHFFGHFNTPFSCSFMVRSQSKQPCLAS